MVSLLLSLVSTLFSDCRRTVSSKYLDTRVSSTSTEELVLPRHARCVLSSTLQRTQPSFRFLSLQDWQNRESFSQRLWTLVPGHLSSHSALSSYGVFAPLTLWRLSVSSRPLVQTLGSCPAFGAPWSPAMPPFLGRSRVSNNNNNKTRKGTANVTREHKFLNGNRGYLCRRIG